MNEEVNRNEISQNTKENDEDTRRMITRTATFSIDKEAALRCKTCNEEALVLKLEEHNRI